MKIKSQLIITVVNSKEESNSAMSHITEWLRRLRINDSFQPTFTTPNNNETNAKANTSTAICNVMPISGVTTPAKP